MPTQIQLAGDHFRALSLHGQTRNNARGDGAKRAA